MPKGDTLKKEMLQKGNLLEKQSQNTKAVRRSRQPFSSRRLEAGHRPVMCSTHIVLQGN